MNCDAQSRNVIVITGIQAAEEPLAKRRTVSLCYDNSNETAAICRWLPDVSSVIQNKRRTVTLLLPRSLYITHLFLFPRPFIFLFPPFLEELKFPLSLQTYFTLSSC